MRKSWTLLGLVLSLALSADDRILTRAEVFAPVTETYLNPERKYVELDLNGDGIDEIILSESVSHSGTGGLGYDLYASVGPDQFRRMDQFTACALAVEISDEGIRLWSVHRLGALCSRIEYRYFDPKEGFRKSATLEIQGGGDGGSRMAQAILRVIFNDRTVLEPKTWGEALPGAVPERATPRP